MRTIKAASAFKKDFKRIKHTPNISPILAGIVEMLAQDLPLPYHCRDHELIGNWRHFRECHIKPDLLLIYRQTEDGLTLQLARLGSHSELFG